MSATKVMSEPVGETTGLILGPVSTMGAPVGDMSSVSSTGTRYAVMRLVEQLAAAYAVLTVQFATTQQRTDVASKAVEEIEANVDVCVTYITLSSTQFG